VVRIADGVGAAFGALVALARWAADLAPPPADDWAYQAGRALVGALFYGLVGLLVGALVRLVLNLGGGRAADGAERPGRRTAHGAREGGSAV
jgi:hypothetical protein